MLTFHQALSAHRPMNTFTATWKIIQKVWNKKTSSTNGMMTEAEAAAFFDTQGEIWHLIVKEIQTSRTKTIERAEKEYKRRMIEVGEAQAGEEEEDDEDE